MPGDCETFHPLSMDPDGFLLEKGLPQAPATWLRTFCCLWLSWEGSSLFQGVPAAPPSPSSALRNLSSRVWCWVFGRTTSHTRKPTAYGGLLVSTHPVRPGSRGVVGEVLLPHPAAQTSCGLQRMSRPWQQQSEPLCWLLCCRWSGRGGELHFHGCSYSNSDYW